jgi:hypothetical protein
MIEKNFTGIHPPDWISTVRYSPISVPIRLWLETRFAEMADF